MDLFKVMELFYYNCGGGYRAFMFVMTQNSMPKSIKFTYVN